MKCQSPECKNEAEIFGWCNKCLDELGEYIEQHPITSHRNQINLDEWKHD